MATYETRYADMTVVRKIGTSSLADGSVVVSDKGLEFSGALANLCGRLCINKIVLQGKVPTMKKISESLRRPGALRSPKCREYARAMIGKARRLLLVDHPGK